MPARIKKSNLWHIVRDIRIKVAGEWKIVSGGWCKVGGVWKQFYNGDPGAASPIGSFSVSQQVASVSGTRTGSGSVTSSQAKVNVSGGTSPYTYSWTKVSGATLTVNTPTAQQTTFSSSVTEGTSKTAVYRCTVTDSTPGTPLTAYADVNVTLTANVTGGGGGSPTPLSVTISPSTVSGSITGPGTCTTGAATAQPSGGTGSYTSYSWNGNGATVNNPGSQSTTFSRSLADGQSVSNTPSVIVTDSSGATASASCTANFNSTPAPPPPPPPPAPLSISGEPTSVWGFSLGGTAYTQQCVITASGGNPPYTYLWERTGGAGGIHFISSSSASAVNWASSTVGNHSTFWRCTVTDSLGAIATIGISVQTEVVEFP